METKDLLVAGVWAFALIWLVGMLMVAGDMLSSLIVFFIAIAVSAGTIAAPSQKKQP